MKDFTVNVNSEKTAVITINYASATQSGYGHKKIVCEIQYNENCKHFSATTNNMPDFDEACDFEGQEKYEAFYELVKHSMEDQIIEWINELMN